MKNKDENCSLEDYLSRYCIGGSINQTQNSNINVEQPNNNVICSSEIDTNQNNYRVNKNKKTKDDKINQLNMEKKQDTNNRGSVRQTSNSNQKTKQPESNVSDSNCNTINQSNELLESNSDE